VDRVRLVELTTQSKPDAATPWSTRTIAAELGVSTATVSAHWPANGLKPHMVRGFEVSAWPDVRREARWHREPWHVAARTRGAMSSRCEPSV